MTDVEPPDSDDETTRRKYLHHESSIRAIGSFYLLGALFMALLAFPMMESASKDWKIYVFVAFYLAFCTAQLWAGWNLRQLFAKGRILGIVVAVPWLAALGFGTVISVYILYLLLSPNCKIVMSPQYQRVIENTPNVQHRTPILTWVIVLLVLLFAAAMAIPGFMSGR